MRIGIWCDYEQTLVPSEGIGVFVHNLSVNLVSTVGNCEVLMVASLGESRLLQGTVERGMGRIQVLETPKQSAPNRFVTKQLLRLRWKRFAKEGWISRKLDTAVRILRAPRQASISKLVDQADVWLLPYVRIEHHFHKPTVVCIHDLVCYHYPEMMKPHRLLELKHIVDRVSSQSTLVACMSNFIKQNDLVGQLKIPERKIRVVRAAVPEDLGTNSLGIGCHESVESINPHLKSPYLFYPSAFRLYKNHVLLVRALDGLRRRTGLDWKLVFTGIHECPSYIEEEIQARNLKDHVIVLQHVHRNQLMQLYRNAFATVVPSLYEQGSFPLMEALSVGCPVLSSNIPSLREQLEMMGGQMLFFDPHDANDLEACCLELMANREEITASQLAGFARRKDYHWSDAARAWHHVFSEAIDLKNSVERSRVT